MVTENAELQQQLQSIRREQQAKYRELRQEVMCVCVCVCVCVFEEKRKCASKHGQYLVHTCVNGQNA